MFNFKDPANTPLDDRAVFANHVCSLLVAQHNGNVHRAAEHAGTAYGHFINYVRNIYDLIDIEIPLFALYKLQTGEYDNVFSDIDAAEEKAERAIVSACLRYYGASGAVGMKACDVPKIARQIAWGNWIGGGNVRFMFFYTKIGLQLKYLTPAANISRTIELCGRGFPPSEIVKKALDAVDRELAESSYRDGKYLDQLKTLIDSSTQKSQSHE